MSWCGGKNSQEANEIRGMCWGGIPAPLAVCCLRHLPGGIPTRPEGERGLGLGLGLGLPNPNTCLVESRRGPKESEGGLVVAAGCATAEGPFAEHREALESHSRYLGANRLTLSSH